MRVFIDADACPVLKIVERLCEKYKVPLIAVKDYNHNIYLSYGEIITLEQGNDHADLYIANKILPEDLVITNDIGLSSLILGKKALCINFYGNIIDQNNIDFLLHSRHVKAKGRKNKKYAKGPAARTSHDNHHFENTLQTILEGQKND